ncbi:MAG: transglutaminase-like domain-containing protein [Candidatus Aenigmatarchaeota archaeon]
MLEGKLQKLGNIKGDRGVELTVKRIIEKILDGTKDPVIIINARRIIAKGNAKTDFERAKLIYDYIKRNIRYVKDPVGFEMLIMGGKNISAAQKILSEKVGDCDEHVILAGAMLRAIGIPISLVTIATPQTFPFFSHIYLAVKTEYGWIPFDTTVPEFQFGDQYPFPKRVKFWAVDDKPKSILEFGKIEFKKLLDKGKSQLEKYIKKAAEEVEAKAKEEAYKFAGGPQKEAFLTEKIKESEKILNYIWWGLAIFILLFSLKEV